MKIKILTTLLILNSFLATTAYAGKGMLRISTEPGEAKVYINGKRKGSTPAQKGQYFAVKLAEGEYTIRAEKEDKTGRWVGEKKDVFVGEDTMQIIDLKLKLSLTDAKGNKIEVPKVTSPAKLRKITDTYRSNPNRPKDFIPLGDGTVLDKRTGLIWMQCSLGQQWNGSTCVGTPNKYTSRQQVRSQVIQQMHNYAKSSNWRLPTGAELQTLIYCSSGNDEGRYKTILKGCSGSYKKPTTVGQVFPETSTDDLYWSSDFTGSCRECAQYVSFANGSSYDSGMPDVVRLVRSGQ